MKKPNVNIFQVSVIPPNIEDNTTAVVIYLDISISHLPNSFFITLVFGAKIRIIFRSTICLADFFVIFFGM